MRSSRVRVKSNTGTFRLPDMGDVVVAKNESESTVRQIFFRRKKSAKKQVEL